MSTPALAPTTSQTDWLAEAGYIRDLYEQSPTYPPSILGDPQRVNRFLVAMAAGNYKSTAATIAGFARETLFHLEKKAKDGYLPAIALFNAVEKAEAEAENEMVACVRSAAKAGPQFWAAGMTYLERRQPDRWGKRQSDSSAPAIVVNVHQVGDGEVKVGVQVTGLSPASSLPESESLQISQQMAPESDKQGYVNQAKSLIPEAIALPQRNQSEAGDARATGDTLPQIPDAGAEIRRGTLPRGVAGRARKELPTKRGRRG